MDEILLNQIKSDLADLEADTLTGLYSSDWEGFNRATKRIYCKMERLLGKGVTPGIEDENLASDPELMSLLNGRSLKEQSLLQDAYRLGYARKTEVDKWVAEEEEAKMQNDLANDLLHNGMLGTEEKK